MTSSPQPWNTPLTILLQCLGLDIIFIAGFFVYYQTITPFQATLAIQTTTPAIYSTSIGILLFTTMNLLLPVGFYSIIKSFKISILSTKRLAFLDNIGTLYIINLCFAIASFISFGIFEWLGESVAEPVMPIIAGLFLITSFTTISIGACISQKNWSQGKNHSVLHAFSSSIDWKTSIPYLLGIIIASGILNTGAYPVFTRYQTTWLQPIFLTLQALAVMIPLNSYQIKLYNPKRDHARPEGANPCFHGAEGLRKTETFLMKCSRKKNTHH